MAIEPETMLAVAFEQALIGSKEGGVPVGGAIFHVGGTLLGAGRNRLVQLSITHKFCSKDEAQLDVCEAGHSAPHDGVSWRWIFGASEVASEAGKFGQI